MKRPRKGAAADHGAARAPGGGIGGHHHGLEVANRLDRFVAFGVGLTAVAFMTSAGLAWFDAHGLPRSPTASLALSAVIAMVLLGAARLHELRSQAQTQSDLMAWRLSAFGETADELLWEVDLDGKITFASQMASAMLGHCPDELVGRGYISALIADGDRDRMASLLHTSRRQRTGWTNEQFTYRTNDGHKQLLSSALVRLDNAGQPIGFAGILRDSTVHGCVGAVSQEVRDRVSSVVSKRNINPVFQPIVSLATGAMVGTEALSRFPDLHVRRPDAWFEEATNAGLGVDLEMTALEVCLREAVRSLSPNIYLSANVSPETILSGRLLPVVRHSGWPSRQLVLEITEHVSIADYDCLTSRVGELRALGVRLAVDDAGAGFASFRHILRLQPDYIKLDRTLVDGIDSDPAKRALAGAVVDFGQAVGAVVVAEGIETAAELRACRMLGIQCGQGFFIGRPVVASQLLEGRAHVHSLTQTHQVLRRLG